MFNFISTLRVILLFVGISDVFSECDIGSEFDISSFQAVGGEKYNDITINGIVINDIAEFSCVCSSGLKPGMSKFANITGWLSLEECGVLVFASKFASFVQRRRATDADNYIFKYIEVGSYQGLSSNIVGSTFRAIGRPAHIFAHDLYQWDNDDENRSHMQIMFDNVKNNDMIGTILPIIGFNQHLS